VQNSNLTLLVQEIGKVSGK